MPPITDNQILKKLYNAFDGLPLSPENENYDKLYVDCQKVRGDSNIIDDIGRHIEWSDNTTCQLYAGHRGAGKSTELLRLRKYLQDKGYHVVYFTVDKNDMGHNYSLGYIGILLACIRKLLANMEEIDVYTLSPNLGAIKLSGFPVYNIDKDRMQLLLEELNDLIAKNRHYKVGLNKLVLMVDNLDRIVPIYNEKSKRTNHEEIFLDRSEQLTALNCHVIYTVPISLVYSEQGTLLKDRYENLGILPMVTMHARTQEREQYVPGLAAFHELLDKRAQMAANISIQQVFGDERVIQQLCLISGGHFRNLMQLIQGTLRYLPQFRDAKKAMARSILNMRETYLGAINDADWKRLVFVYLTQQIKNEQGYQDLLSNHCVLEYREASDENRDAKWQDVHPIIWEIKQFQKALDHHISHDAQIQETNYTLQKIISYISSLSIKHLSVFKSETLKLSEGLNIIIGENGAGKSHLLKSAYSLIQASYNFTQQKNYDFLETVTRKLIHVFRAESVSYLINHDAPQENAEIQVEFTNSDLNVGLTFDRKGNTQIINTPQAFLAKSAVFFPTKEAISIYPKFGGLYRDYNIELDETYYDLCLLLERPTAKKPNQETQYILSEIENILGGQIIDKNGRFYLKMPGKPEIEMHLLAEGLRKIATLAYLVANDSLVGNILFWDEPESNLNPKLVRSLVKILLLLVQKGTQVILATHSLFLLREFEVQLKHSQDDIPRRFFALGFTETGEVKVTSGEVIHDLDPITALDAEINQSEEYYELVAEEE